MKYSDAGIAFTQAFESCRLKAYKDGGGRWTCGWGDAGPDVGQNTLWTQQEADDRFAQRIRGFEDCVNEAVTVELTQYQFDACLDLAYNIGCKAFTDSTLVKRLNEGDFAGAALQFLRWKYDNGALVPGLERRRIAEKAMFEGEA